VGAYLAWIRPRRVYRDVQSGKISEEQGRQKLRKFSPGGGILLILFTLLGFLVMIASLVFSIVFR